MRQTLQPLQQDFSNIAYTMRILLVDDHKIFRQGLRLLLERKGYQSVSEASNGAEAIHITKTQHPDVVILDFSMPGMTGIDTAREIQKHSPNTQIILLVTHEDNVNAIEALRVGIHGYLYKSQDSDELVNTITAVIHGDIHFSASISPSAIDSYITDSNHNNNPLTEREREVLVMIAAGYTAKYIGEALGVSSKTVESHRSSIMRKLNIHRTAGLIRYAIRQQLITP